MINFIIFSIKPEIAYHYYEKTEILKQLLMDWISNPTSPVLTKQVQYIAERFPFNDWIESGLRKKRFPFYDSTSLCAIMDNKNYCCLFQCESMWQAETVVLNRLRPTSQPFFVLESNGKHYGWV